MNPSYPSLLWVQTGRLCMVWYTSEKQKYSTLYISVEGCSARTLLIFKHNRIPVQKSIKLVRKIFTTKAGPYMYMVTFQNLLRKIYPIIHYYWQTLEEKYIFEQLKTTSRSFVSYSAILMNNQINKRETSVLRV